MARHMTDDELQHFQDHGYVIVKNVLKDEDFAAIKDEYTALIHAKALELQEQGKIKKLHEEAPFERRLALIAAQCSEETFAEDLAKWGQQLDTMYALQQAVFRFFFNERLLNCIESVVGPEITLSPIQHLRPFLPARKGLQRKAGAASLTPWHQDQGVTREEADASDILTCWIPLVGPVGPGNGCVKVMPDQGAVGLLPHIKSDYGTTIDPAFLPDASPVDCAMERGDILLIHKFTPHCSTINNSDMVRWSIDLRFQKTGTPTGRHFWPEFVLRSREQPDSVQDDYEDWKRRWRADLETSKGERWHRVAGDVGGSIADQQLSDVEAVRQTQTVKAY